MTRRAATALGIGQCLNWGVLYYAFAVLVLPLQRELAVPTWVVTGAFSLALLVSALLAPRVGVWCDRGHAPRLMQAGGLGAALLLAAWTLVPGVATLYAVWAGLGACMAATLYEPAFAIVGRAFDDAAQRLRALAAITLFGGLASTVFLPLTALLVSTVEWRGAVRVLAAVMVGSTLLTRSFVNRRSPRTAGPGPVMAPPASSLSGRAANPPRWLLTASMFAISSLASAALASNFVPALGERGITAAAAAMLGGLLGVMQLPGRALLMHGALGGTPDRLLSLSLTLQAAGLCGVAFAPSMVVAAAGTSIFALGSGLTALVRPHLVHSLVGGVGDGYLNGRIARQQQLARAAGPLAVAWLAGALSYTVVFAGIAILFVVVGPGSQRWLRGTGRPDANHEPLRASEAASVRSTRQA